jgi:hypothetical protein
MTLLIEYLIININKLNFFTIMENCYVEKLKSVLNNDSLRKVGDIEVSVHLTTNTSVFLNIAGADGEFSVNTYPINKVTEVTGYGIYRAFSLSTGDYKVRIKPTPGKSISYILSRITAPTSGNSLSYDINNYLVINTEELIDINVISNNLLYKGDLSNLSEYTVIDNTGVSNYIKDDIAYLRGGLSELNENITKIDLQDIADYIIGNISILNSYPSLTSVKLVNSGYNDGAGVSGDIGSINNTNLEKLMFNRNAVTGNIEDLVEAQISNNRDYSTKEWLHIIFNTRLKINNQSPATSKYIWIHFTSTGAQITESNKTTVIATYVKSTDTWTYA